MPGHLGLINGTGVIVQAPGDGQVHFEVGLRYAEISHVAHHLGKLLDAGVQQLVLALQLFQSFHGIGAFQHFQQLGSGIFRHGKLAGEHFQHLFLSDLLQLVNGAHHIGGLVPQPQQVKQTAEHLPVVQPDLEIFKAQGGEGAVDHRGNFSFAQDIQLAIADDVDVRLVKLPEASTLGPLAPVDLADLIPAERKCQVVIVKGHIFGQGHGEIKAESQIAVPLLEAVDLLFGVAAALGQQHFGGLDHRCVQAGEAIQLIALAQNVHHPVHLGLPVRQKLHKTGKGAGFHFAHSPSPVLLREIKKRLRPSHGTKAQSFVVPPNFGGKPPF